MRIRALRSSFISCICDLLFFGRCAPVRARELGSRLAAPEYLADTGNDIGVFLSVRKIVDGCRLCLRLMTVFESLGPAEAELNELSFEVQILLLKDCRVLRQERFPFVRTRTVSCRGLSWQRRYDKAYCRLSGIYHGY